MVDYFIATILTAFVGDRANPLKKQHLAGMSSADGGFMGLNPSYIVDTLENIIIVGQQSARMIQTIGDNKEEMKIPVYEPDIYSMIDENSMQES